ncbi:MAG: hypothetical protein V4638_10360 [Bacteroidota bacterium]
MKKSYFQILALAVLLVFTSSSCKKCKVENITTDSGAIITEAVVYPVSGYMPYYGPALVNGYVIGPTHNYANNFKVSFDGGPKTNVDWSQYRILVNPVKATCNASYNRNVTIDNTAQTVSYSINCEQCTLCDYEVNTDNYVLVPIFPDNYTLNRTSTVVDKD